jgi:hypothetical protein
MSWSRRAARGAVACGAVAMAAVAAAAPGTTPAAPPGGAAAVRAGSGAAGSAAGSGSDAGSGAGSGAAVDAGDWTRAVLARTDRIARVVSRLRRLPRRRRIAREVVSVDELRRRLAAETRGGDDAGAVTAEALAVKRWGLIPAGADYGQLMVDVLTEQIAGYYDRDARKLFIAARATGDDSWADMLLAHEIDHALCDQHFDLRRLFHLPADQGDALAARRALVEGDGVALMVEVLLAERGKAAPWSDPEAALTLEHALEADGPAGGQLGAAPLWVREQLMFPYRAGLGFVAAIRRHHAWDRVDRVYRRPPRSTEQILHPAAYDADERPIPVTDRTPNVLSGWRTVYQDVWGEEGWMTFLRAHGVDGVAAATAAAGWGGDRVAVYARPDDDAPDHAVGVALTVWDTEVDAREAAEALVRAVDGFAGAQAEAATDRGRWLAAGRVSWVERRGDAVAVVVGAPVDTADALAEQVWTAWRIHRPARHR